MEYYIKGNYKKSIYQSDSGYIIGLFKVRETNDKDLVDYIDRIITFTGYFHEINTEDTYIMYGDIINHEKYGEQFQVSKYERVMPEEKDSIVEFLGGGLFKGVGEKKAKKIVDFLGKDTLKVILENPDNLLLIPTITKKQVDILYNTLRDYESSYETIIKLNELGFSSRDSMLIYRKFQSKTDLIIKDNLYLFMTDDYDITFKKLDVIALGQGYPKDDIRRIKGAILYIMSEVCNLIGHSYLLNGEIYGYLLKVLGIHISTPIFDQAIADLALDKKIIIKDEHYYLTSMFEAEKNIANRLRYLASLVDTDYKKIDQELVNLEEKNQITYNNDQKKAIINAISKNVLIITGGPGTGKTTIIKAITGLYQSLNKYSYEKMVERIALLAPTGRASKRISEATLLPAVTIHRFLKWNKDTNLFAVNEYNKSNVEFVIIDEVSMMDVNLLDNLLKGLKINTKIILVGDDNQLPSVGPGQILRDMIESEELPVVKLVELYRQGKDSNIITLAYDINKDYLDQTLFNKQEDLTFIACDSMVVKENIRKICMPFKNMDYRKFQVLAPMYKTLNGIDELNMLLQSIFNPKASAKKEIIINGITYREQDKVIQLSNMPDENVFNGDIGIITHIENGLKKVVTIEFDLTEVHYTPSNFNKFKHAFAISIHKSQGSEFDVVVMPIVQGYHKMLYRKLIYTGVTRAKKKLYLIGEIEALNYAIHHNEVDLRRTTLKDMLKRSIK
ncbi:MAG: ATP-dependent RecD-like DNA helicase [Bacilli bacterium]